MAKVPLHCAVPVFAYDVFLCHATADTPVAHELAARLQRVGFRVSCGVWELRRQQYQYRYTDNRASESDDGLCPRDAALLKTSRIVIFCTSETTQYWWNSVNTRFPEHDRQNRDRWAFRLTLDDATIRGDLNNLWDLDWRSRESRQTAYKILLYFCQLPGAPVWILSRTAHRLKPMRRVAIGGNILFHACRFAFPSHGHFVIGCHYRDRAIFVWDLPSGRGPLHLEGHLRDSNCLAVTPDGRYAISGSEDETARVWGIEARCCLQVLTGHTSSISSVTLSVDGRLAITSAYDGTIRIWNALTGECRHVFSVVTTTQVSLSRDGKWLASSHGPYHQICIWDTESGEGRTLGMHPDAKAVTLSADGRTAVSVGGLTVRVWDVESGLCRRIMGWKNWMTSVSLDPTGRFVLVGGFRALRLWCVETGRCLCVLIGKMDQVYSVAWSADGRHAFSGDSNGDVLLWDLAPYVAGHVSKTDYCVMGNGACGSLSTTEK